MILEQVFIFVNDPDRVKIKLEPFTPSNTKYTMPGMIGEALKGHLDLLLLAVLEKGPAHGYVIIEMLRERSGGTFDLPEGTIYPALHRMEENGLLSSHWTENGGRRRSDLSVDFRRPAGIGQATRVSGAGLPRRLIQRLAFNNE